MNFSAISGKTIIGKVIRFPLRIIPASFIIKIIQGPNKGKKWIVGSGIHGYWLGSYEYEKQFLFWKFLKKGNIVFDIGANVGYYSLIASSSVGNNGHVFAFEPAPKNINFLKKHLAINDINNVSVLQYAISSSSGEIQFDESINSFTGHISPNGKLKVKAASLDDLQERNVIPVPDIIKIDIEGAEMDALLGAQLLIEKSHPTIFMATHDRIIPGVHKKCCDFLKQQGYTITPLRKGNSIENLDEFIATYDKR